MKRIFRIVIILFLFLGGLALLLFSPVDREPYGSMKFYAEMDQRLDSLKQHLPEISSNNKLMTGWAKTSITPANPLPLAGYGKRNPKEFEQVHDSIFVRTMVFQSGENKAVLVSADLLIFHPLVTAEIKKNLPYGWTFDELYLTTTHSHSSLGGWAPGILGEAISGAFNDTIPTFIAEKVSESITVASQNMKVSSLGLSETDLRHLVHNRLVQEKGTKDPWLKSVLVDQGEERGILNFFSAHATCLTSNYRNLSGDFPGSLNKQIDLDSLFDFSLYGAGAVGSMGPVTTGNGWERASILSNSLKKQVDMLTLLGIPKMNPPFIRSFKLALPLREPQAKISQNWAIRPYLFKEIAGDYDVYISVLQLGSIVFVGIPADFSGELALPLYKRARELGLNLIITSFNGGYIGYVVKDDWYDLNKYEARAMSWYGPDNGTYLSEVVSRILDVL